jgi:hypothetical protein
VEEFYSINPDTRVDWYVGMTLVKPIHPIDRSNKVIDHSLVSKGLQVSSRLDNTQKITESNGDSLDVRFSGKSAESMIPKGNTKMEINILGLLPFFVKDYVNETPIARRSIIAMSFRQGMEAAAALWLDTNSTVNLHYADTYNNDDSIRTALSEPKADSLDLIIGPLYAERMINLAINTDPELLVSPLSKSPSIGNAGVWNAVVSEEVLWEGVWSYLDQKINHNKTTNKPQKLLLVGTKSSKNNSLSGKAVTIFGESIVKVVLNDESWVQNEQLARLDTSVLYNLVLLDNDPAFLLDALRNLREGRAKYHWIAQERQIVDRGLVNNVFERENITTIYSGYIDYTLKETLDFVAFFREKFGREPDKYAFIAYDITTFHMKRLVYRQHSWRGLSLGFDYSTGQRFNSYTETRVYKNHSWQLTNATLAK